MTTEKLYYIDSHMFAFEARVLDCREEKSGWAVILDRTAFFPEGGGQLADTGYIGSVRVTDVQERGGEILHYTDTPLEPGLTVSCRLDAVCRTTPASTSSPGLSTAATAMITSAFTWVPSA